MFVMPDILDTHARHIVNRSPKAHCIGNVDGGGNSMAVSMANGEKQSMKLCRLYAANHAVVWQGLRRRRFRTACT